MPQLNPYQEMIAPYQDRSDMLKEYSITVEYIVADGEDATHWDVVDVKALNIDDAFNIASEIIKEVHPEIYDIIDIRESSMFEAR